MENINQLINIAQYLGLSNIVSDLEAIDMRSKQENANLILPLVGEFSSGKTSLINAITDSKKLESATKPTTATIYEVHFACDSCHAQVVKEDGTLQEIDDIAELKNDVFADAQVVTVFDTSKKIPSSTILVDTPGLSSPEAKHKQTLVNFLPKADGILLVTDINQQITRSLTDFIDTMKLSKRPIYLVLTKSDTKSASDVEAAKKYISQNCQIPLQQVAVVSATTNSLDEFYSLIDSIQKDKKQILQAVDNQRIKNIIPILKEHIAELMAASSSDKDLDEAIRRSQYELEKINRNIDTLVESLSDDISNQERSTTRRFEDIIFEKLNSLVTSNSTNYDAEALSTINSTATLLMNDYKDNIQNIIREKAKKQKTSNNESNLSSISDIDLYGYQINGLSYNLDLNMMGHEYDKAIKKGIIATITLGGAIKTIGSKLLTATKALTYGATHEDTKAVTDGKTKVATNGSTNAIKDGACDTEHVDTSSDAGSTVSNKDISKKLQGFTNNYQKVEQTSQQISKQIGVNNDVLESMIGFVTDKLLAKPQRVRAIRNYIDSSLSPEFKTELRSLSQELVSSIKARLHNEAQELIGQKTDSLNQLKNELKEKKNVFDQRMKDLKEFNTILLNY